MDLSWMAWTWPTAAFFAAVALILCLMLAWEIASPTVERVGVLGIATSRGDRLFMSLLSAAFIHLAWLGLVGPDLLWALGLSIVWSVIVFGWF